MARKKAESSSSKAITDQDIVEQPIDSNQHYRGEKNIPKENAEFVWTKAMVNEIKKCKDDIIHFAQNHFTIVHLDRGKEKIQLYVAQKQVLRALMNNRFVALLASRQCGKALGVDTPIRTTDGWKTMGTIVAGDTVFGSDGQPTRVTYAHEVMYDRPCYKVTFDTGETIIADASHEWFTQNRNERKRDCRGSVKTTEQIFNTLFSGAKGEPNHRIPVALSGINTVFSLLPIDPYVLGLWLGDGAAAGPNITVGHRDVEHIVKVLQNNSQFDKLLIKKYPYNPSYTLTPSVQKGVRSKSLSFLLREQNLINNKHIPENYFNSSREQKIELLKGLMDSDGFIDSRGFADFSNTNKTLAYGVYRLLYELGYKATITSRFGKFEGETHKEVFIVRFKPREYVVTIPFKKERIKLEGFDSSKRSQFHYITNIEACESVPVRCLTVDAKDSLYLAGESLIPTHNSTVTVIYALWLACFFGDQRIVIVANKEQTAINIFKKVRLAYEQLPMYLKPGVKEYGKTGLTFDNDSSIGVSTTTSSAVRGDSINCLIVDEMAFIEPNMIDEFWSSVIPVVSSSKKSKIFAVSTPNGTFNKFYDIYSAAEKGDGDWKACRIDWWEVPGRTERWKKQMISALGSEEAFLQEFGNVFLDPGSCAVGAGVIERFKAERKKPVYSSDDGTYLVFEEPDPLKAYVIGVDVGEGVGRASSVAQVLDVTDLRDIKQVAVYGTNLVEPYHFANHIYNLAHSWGRPPMLIERNSCGAQLIDALFYNLQYEKLICYSKLADKGTHVKTRNIGVFSHNNIRFAGTANLRYWMNTLQTVMVHDIVTIKELETFIKYPNGVYRRKSDKFYDDRVMAMVWALFCLIPDIATQYFEVLQCDPQGRPFLMEVREDLIDRSEKYYVLRDLTTPVEMAEGLENDMMGLSVGGFFSSNDITPRGDSPRDMYAERTGEAEEDLSNWSLFG